MIEDIKDSIIQKGKEESHGNVDSLANTTTALTTSESSTGWITCSNATGLDMHNVIMNSCQQLAKDYPNAPSGLYWVKAGPRY